MSVFVMASPTRSANVLSRSSRSDGIRSSARATTRSEPHSSRRTRIGTATPPGRLTASSDAGPSAWSHGERFGGTRARRPSRARHNRDTGRAVERDQAARCDDFPSATTRRPRRRGRHENARRHRHRRPRRRPPAWRRAHRSLRAHASRPLRSRARAAPTAARRGHADAPREGRSAACSPPHERHGYSSPAPTLSRSGARDE